MNDVLRLPLGHNTGHHGVEVEYGGRPEEDDDREVAVAYPGKDGHQPQYEGDEGEGEGRVVEDEQGVLGLG